MVSLCHKTIDANIEELAPHTVLARISSTAVDREGDVMLPSGLDLSEFKSNPIVIWKHGQSHSIEMPVGTAPEITTNTNDVMACVKFADRPSNHPGALEWVPDTIHSLYKQGVLRGFSVGFQMDRNGFREATKKDQNRFGKTARRIITRWKMTELSVAPVPMNQDALAVAVSKGFVQPDSWTVGHMGTNYQRVEAEMPKPIAVGKPQPLRVARKRLSIPGSR